MWQQAQKLYGHKTDRVHFQAAGASHPRHLQNDPEANPNFHQTEIDLFIMTRNRIKHYRT
jgi:hypothetical protein